MKDALWVAGALQIVVAAANLPAKRILSLDAELAKLSPMARQIYRVQHAYIAGLLLFFAAISPLLTAAGPLSVALSGMLAIFWAARLGVQVFYYDPETRRRHRVAPPRPRSASVRGLPDPDVTAAHGCVHL